MEDLTSSLVEASVSFSEIRSDHLWLELLKKLSGVKSLSVQTVSYQLLRLWGVGWGGGLDSTSAAPSRASVGHGVGIE
ncbi:hypothetical protein HanIR_Chr05g0223731 [Helianthus annuus]|nr:hypothetical protein HanIR_Chr05g0223731 [Helianthus annuus]